MQKHNVTVQVTFNLTLDQWAWSKEHAMELAAEEGFDVAQFGDGSGSESVTEPKCDAVASEQLYELSTEQIEYILEAVKRPENCVYDDDPDHIIDSLTEAGLIWHSEDQVPKLDTYAIIISEMIQEKESNNEST